MKKAWLGPALVALGTSISSVASANPEPLPFSYVAATLPKNELEVELYTDVVPTKALDGGTGAAVNFAATQFQLELEYGLSRRFELGLYVTMAPSIGDSFTTYPEMPEANGVKERLKFHAADATWPLDLSFYLELAENTREFEIEGKLIAERRFGPLRAIGNVWLEREQYWDGRGEWDWHPTAGLVYEVSPMIQPGLEAWMHAEVPDTKVQKVLDNGELRRPFAFGPHLYVGPTILLSFSKLWWSTGAYFRVTDVTRPTVAGDAYGKLWFRALFGVPL